MIIIARKVNKYAIVHKKDETKMYYCMDSLKFDEQIYKKSDQLEFSECPKNLPYNYDSNIPIVIMITLAIILIILITIIIVIIIPDILILILYQIRIMITIIILIVLQS